MKTHLEEQRERLFRGLARQTAAMDRNAVLLRELAAVERYLASRGRR